MKVLFLTHRVPYAPNRGDRIRAFHVIRTLAPRVELDVVSLAHDRAELAQADSIKDAGVRVSAFLVPRLRNRLKALGYLAGARPLTHALLDAPGLLPSVRELIRERPPDVVLAYCSSMARFALEEPLSHYPLVIDLVDVDSVKWAALAERAAAPKRWIYRREARLLASFEREAATKARVTLVVNEREQGELQTIAPGAAVRVLPAGVDAAALQPPEAPTVQPRVVFCGVLNYEPNVEGILWFAREVWPLVRARRPDATFSIVGSTPTGSIRQLTTRQSGIEVTGTVPDVRPYLWRAAVSIAPLLTSRGVQTKALEAVAAGLPVVMTSAVSGGLPSEIGPASRIADSPETFASHVVDLLERSGPERRSIAGSADLSGLSWESRLAPLYQILAEASGAAR